MGGQVVASTGAMPPEDETEAPLNRASNNSIERTPLRKQERTAMFKDYLRLFTYATLWDKVLLAAGILAAMGSGVTQPLMFILFGRFVGEFNGIVTGDGSADLHAIEHTINKLCLFVFALFIARFGLASIHKFAFRMIGIRISAAVRLRYLRRLFDQSMHVLDSMPPGQAVGTITSSSNTVQSGISEKLALFIEYTTMIIASFVVSLVWNWELSLVTMAGFVVVVLVVGTLFPLTMKGQARQIELDGQAASIASESFASIRMIMACGAQQQTVSKYRAFVEAVKKQAQSTNPLTSLQFSLTFFGVFGTIALTFWYGTRLFTKNRLADVGVITVVLMNLTTIFFSLDRVSTPMQAMSKASLAACEFFSVIDAHVPQKGTLKAPDVSATDDIMFNNVTFAYPGRPNVKVLDELDLRIEAGKVTAIVGSSGSGKSTIVGLVERWYSLTQQQVITRPVQQGHGKGAEGSGSIPMDNLAASEAGDENPGSPVELRGTITTCGHSLDDIDVKWWRSKIGLVQQEPFLFNDTIYENVALLLKLNQVVRSLTCVGTSFIRKLGV